MVSWILADALSIVLDPDIFFISQFGEIDSQVITSFEVVDLFIKDNLNNDDFLDLRNKRYPNFF